MGTCYLGRGERPYDAETVGINILYVSLVINMLSAIVSLLLN